MGGVSPNEIHSHLRPRLPVSTLTYANLTGPLKLILLSTETSAPIASAEINSSLSRADASSDVDSLSDYSEEALKEITSEDEEEKGREQKIFHQSQSIPLTERTIPYEEVLQAAQDPQAEHKHCESFGSYWWLYFLTHSSKLSLLLKKANHEYLLIELKGSSSILRGATIGILCVAENMVSIGAKIRFQPQENMPGALGINAHPARPHQLLRSLESSLSVVIDKKPKRATQHIKQPWTWAISRRGT